MNAAHPTLEVWTVLDQEGTPRGLLTRPGETWVVYLDGELAAVTRATGGLASLAVLMARMIDAPVRLERGFDVSGALADIGRWHPEWRDEVLRGRDLAAIQAAWTERRHLDDDGLSVLRLLRARARRHRGFASRCVQAWGGDEGLSNLLRREGARC